MYMSGGSCPGYLQVPTPVYWSPYLAALPRRPALHLADILPATQKPPPAFLSPTASTERRAQQRSKLHAARELESKELDRVNNEPVSKRDIYRSLHRTRRHDAARRPCADDQCSVTSALEPLQALCTSGVQQYASGTPGQRHTPITGPASPPKELAFGITQILSEDFGKKTSNKENMKMSPVPPPERRPCECTTMDGPVFPTLYYPAHTLSAVETIQPHTYHTSPPGTDILPGPYSVMNSDVHVGNHQKRKRSWSRAVFSNLQRKGLEKRFDVQKYVTKPDRRQLAAMLGLTDAQVKVWFQNRRMKWRHSQQTTTGHEKNGASEADDISVDAFHEVEPEDSASCEEESENATDYSTTHVGYTHGNITADDISDECYVESSFTETSDNVLPDSRDVS